MNKDYSKIKISFSREDLDPIINSSDYSPEKLINLLRKDFKDLYDADSGVWEGYSIKDHSLMVMRQFEKYYQDDSFFNKVSKSFFRFLLSLHDIGKSLAIKKGDKNYQYSFSLSIVKNIFQQLSFSKKDYLLFKAIIEADVLGSYLKGSNISEAVFKIIKKSKEANLGLLDFLNILEIYYKVDAGSYTKDAGGKESLDYMFNFKSSISALNFSDETELKMKKLRKLISNA